MQMYEVVSCMQYHEVVIGNFFRPNGYKPAIFSAPFEFAF